MISVKGFRICLVMFFATFASYSPAISNELPNTYTTQVVRALFDSGAFSFHFDADVLRVARNYTQRTRYAGKVRVNQPLLPGFLNIYVFKRGHGFRYERLLKDTCRAFRDSDVVICDDEFLDSMPSSPPVLFEGGSDTVPPSALLYWVMGHEIGHLVLGHTASAFYPVSVSEAKQTVTDGSPEIIPTKSTLREETEADRFAVSGMPIRSNSDWVYFGNPIMDALLWEIGKKGIKSDWGDAETPPQKLTVRSDASGHPPLIMRLYDLVLTIRKNYSDFPFPENFAPKVQFDISENAPREYASPFYGKTYLGSNDDRFTHATKLLDLATYLVVTGRDDELGGLKQQVCEGGPSLDETSEIQRSVVCGRHTDTDILSKVSQCSLLYKEASFRCYALITLVAISCKSHTEQVDTQNAYCADLGALDRIYATYAEHQFPLPTDASGLLNWSLAAQYYYQVSVTGNIDDILLEWVIGIAQQPGVADQRSVGMEILLAHTEVLEKLRSQQWEAIATLDSAIADRGLRLDNDDLALVYQQKAVDRIAANMGKDSETLAFHMMKLARIMRGYNVYNMGASDARASGLFDEDLAERLGRPSTDFIKKSGKIAQEASQIYQRLLTRSEAEKPSDAQAVNYLRILYINALGGAIFSYNMALDVDEALAASLILQGDLERYKELSDQDGYERAVLAPALENISLAFVASSKGDAAVALQLALKALAIREGNGQDTLLPQRIAAYAYFRLREFRKAAEATKAYIAKYEASTHRRFPLNSGMLVGGETVTLEDLFRKADRYLDR